MSLGTVCSIGAAEFRELASALSALPAHVVWKVGKDDLPAGLDLGSLGLGSKVKVIHPSLSPSAPVLQVSGLHFFEFEDGDTNSDVRRLYMRMLVWSGHLCLRQRGAHCPGGAVGAAERPAWKRACEGLPHAWRHQWPL